jgi:hypothetical protein
MISAFILSQILIGIAFLFDLASFQFEKRKFTLICFASAATLISAHYFLLGQSTAGFIAALAATRYVTSVFSTDPRLKYLFIVLVTFAGVWTFDEWFDVLAVAAGYLATFAVFQSSEKRLRVIMTGATLLLIAYNTIIFTPAGIALETFFLLSNLVSYWRFYIRKQTPIAQSN